MPGRIAPLAPPYPEAVQKRLDAIMPAGMDPLVLFTTLARNERVFQRFMAGGLLDKGSVTMRDREIVIDRTTARCGAEYEWGVHVSGFAAHVKLTEAQIASTVRGGPEDACWDTDRDRLILRLADSLHDTNTVPDELWSELAAEFSEEQLLELVVLAGFYHTVSFVCRAFDVPLEAYAARFPAA